MDVIEWIKGVFVEGGVADPEAPVVREPRKYKVPDRLAFRVAELSEHLRLGSPMAKFRLWELLTERCPEAKEGDWKLKQVGNDFWLVEVLP